MTLKVPPTLLVELLLYMENEDRPALITSVLLVNWDAVEECEVRPVFHPTNKFVINGLEVDINASASDHADEIVAFLLASRDEEDMSYFKWVTINLTSYRNGQ